MNRRDVFHNLARTAAGLWTLRVHVVVTTFIGSEKVFAQEKAFDLIMDGFSIYDGQKLGKAGELKATQIAAMRPITGIPYEQDSDGHTFDLSVANLRQLIAGTKVEVETSEKQNHKHKVVIDPKNKANPSSPGVDVGGQPDVVGPDNSGGSDVAGGGDLRTILDNECTECHHPGAATPMPLTGALTKEQNVKIIERLRSKDATKVMPPGFRGSFSEEQIVALEKLLGN